MKETEPTIELPAKSTEFIAHRDTMLLVDQLLEYSKGNVKGTAIINEDNPFLDKSGIVSRICLVEIIAQTVASGKGYEAMIYKESPKTGFLVGVNDFNFLGDVKINDKLTITSQEESHVGDFTIISGKIEVNSKIVAHGNLKFYEIEGDPVKSPSKFDNSLSGEALPDTANRSFLPINDKSPFFKSISESSFDFKTFDQNTKASASFCFKNNFIGFEGHFPDYPILPGVVMMEILLLLAETLFEKPLEIKTIRKAKFSKQSYAEDLLNAELSMTLVENLWTINAKLACNDMPVSSLILKASSN